VAVRPIDARPLARIYFILRGPIPVHQAHKFVHLMLDHSTKVCAKAASRTNGLRASLILKDYSFYTPVVSEVRLSPYAEYDVLGSRG
jgi:hypothetical protein